MNKEIETRFLEIDKADLIRRLRELEAEDRGEILLKETIFYDPGRTWAETGRLVRLRQHGDREIRMTYKHRKADTIDGTYEAEFAITDAEEAHRFLEGIGLEAVRWQEKYRHTFVQDGVLVDIDTWPQVPSYVELEGPSEDKIKTVATLLGLEWAEAVFEGPRRVLKKRYGIALDELRWFTFDRME